VTLARKQDLPDQARWQHAIDTARDVWPDPRLDELIALTVKQITETTAGKRAAFAWSGGKDSLALAHVCEQAGIEDCVLAISNLEYPAFLQWVTDFMPPGLTVISTGQDLAWLRDHPAMLFPQGAHGSRWFQIVNHRGQETYYRDRGLDVLLLGRRRLDGNYTGPDGQDIYTNARGITRYSPLADWPHEAVFALIQRENITLPPCYSWPRGFQVGTGSWPARQWTRDTDHGFEECWQIDPDVIRGAAVGLPQAAEWMTRTGRT
jgi:Phosphoadenosine phosphosulfate reductase family